MKNNKGFSLVELIIVIAIMAILVGVMAPQLIKYIEKSKISTDVQLCETCRQGITDAIADAATDNVNIPLQGGSVEQLCTGSFGSYLTDILGTATPSSMIKSTTAGSTSRIVKFTIVSGNQITCSINSLIGAGPGFN